MRRVCLFALLLSSVAETLYERLGLSRSASAREIKKAWHLLALKLHPDKVEGSAADKEAATAKFKAAAEAYEVLSEASLKKSYDASGVVPDDKAKTEARASPPSTADEDEQYGFDSDNGRQQQQRGGSFHSWNFRYDAFEISLAQQRARRVRTLDKLRSLLQPASGARFGLVGFYRAGDEASLKRLLRFPYPFAGWSLAAAGDGFWWEDALQTALVSVGNLASNDGKQLLDHFGISCDDPGSLPAVAWVRKDEALSFDIIRTLRSHEDFVGWVYKYLGASIRVVNRDHRNALVWWLDGHSAKRQAVLKPGESLERSSFVSHRWYVWPEATEGNLLTPGACLGDITLSNVGEMHELILEPKCVDTNGHCGQWRQLGECERNPVFMLPACPHACGGCDEWGWLYPLGLAQMHDKLRCWADVACATSKGFPVPGARENTTLRAAADLRRLPMRVISWLEGSDADESTKRALRAAIRPPPTPLPARPASPPPPPPPPLGESGSKKDEL